MELLLSQIPILNSTKGHCLSVVLPLPSFSKTVPCRATLLRALPFCCAPTAFLLKDRALSARPSSGLSVEKRSLLAEKMELVEFADGASIMVEGDEGDCMYIIDKGTAAVRVKVRHCLCLAFCLPPPS